MANKTKPQVLSYNDIALRLNRVSAKIHNGFWDAPALGADAVTQKELIAQRDALQKQLDEATPKGQYTAQQAHDAGQKIVQIREQRDALIAKGAKTTDPAIQNLANEYNQQNAIYNQFNNDQTAIDKIKSDSQIYVKSQNTQLSANDKAASEAELNKTQLTDLQNKRAMAATFGEDTSGLDSQIAALQPKSSPLNPEQQNQNANGSAQTLNPTVATPTVGGKGGGSQGGVGSGSNGNKTLPPAASKAVTQAQAFQNFKDAYPQEAALIASDPGLTQVFNQAMSAPGGAWAVPKFQAAYEQSAYYQNHAPSYMSAEQARVGDHAGYVDAYNNMYKDVVSWARDAGIQLDPSVLGGALPTTNLQKGVSAAHAYDPKNPTLIDDLLHKYWDSGTQHQADITRYLATKQSLNPTGGYQAIGGQEFTDAQNLKAYYASMGQNPASVNGKINPNDPTGDIYFANLAHSIAAGTTTAQGEQDKALTSAKSMFPTYASALDAGQTVQGLASPYINSLSSLLETNPNAVDLSQSSGDAQKIKNAMGAGLGQTPMSLTDFETSVRQDPRWGQTLNAQNSVESIGHKILTDFGVTS
jgi:hypothetical protein